MDPWKRKIIFQTIIFRFYVNLQGITQNDGLEKGAPFKTAAILGIKLLDFWGC